MTVEPDRWSQWLLGRRDAGSDRQRAVTVDFLAGVRERILQGTEPLGGSTLLDVGTGDGLIGLAALDRVGERGTVVFSDVSPALLASCRDAVNERGLADRARFVLTGAEDLAGVDDESVDALTTRSVLIFVADKQRAFDAFHRVLRPGGRVSLFEPINRLVFPEPADRLWGYDVAAISDLAAKVKAKFAELQEPAADTMIDFDDRDLLRMATVAGFTRVHMEVHHEVEPGGSMLESIDLQVLLGSAPNPLAPTLGECIERALTARERERVLAHLADAIASGNSIRRSAQAYLVAHKSDVR